MFLKGDVMTNENEEYKHVCPPDYDKIKKPFFAYGIFKPNQIAFSKIEDYAWKWEPHDINREMLMRDGVPIIENVESTRTTRGYKIYFNKEDCESAYDIISKSEPLNLYEWGIIEVDGDECNVLFGKNVSKGSYHSVDKDEYYVGNFNGRNDPFFDGLIKFIRSELKNAKYLDNYFYKIQMYYMLLWSAIDRYCSLKYGAHYEQYELRSFFANDEAFITSLRECLDENELKDRDKVYSSNFLKPFELTTKKPWYAINYYYALRCNVVHRGKEPGNNIWNLKKSLVELLDIFECVLDKTFP